MDSIEEKYLKLLAEHAKLKGNPNCPAQLQQCSDAYRYMNDVRKEMTDSIKNLYSSWLPPKLYSFIQSMKSFLKTGFRKSELVDKRLAICNSCEFYKNSTTCTLCGCYMKGKAALPGAQCPLAKWKAEPEK